MSPRSLGMGMELPARPGTSLMPCSPCWGRRCGKGCSFALTKQLCLRQQMVGTESRGGFQPAAVARSADPMMTQESSGGHAGPAPKLAQVPSADEPEHLFVRLSIIRLVYIHVCICKGSPTLLYPKGRAQLTLPEDQNRNTLCKS